MAKKEKTPKTNKGSETVTVKRSFLKFNNANIKHHMDADIKLQVKNIKKVGILGGIVANSDGTLIDGHRRVMALDIIHKYDGTPDTDYDIKIEKADFDEKTVKSQMAYMALGNSKADYNLVANIIDDIDYRDVGISDEDYEKIHAIAAVDIPTVGMESMDDAFITPIETPTPITELDDSDTKTTEEIIQEHKDKPHMTAEQVKGEKAKCDKVATNRQSNQDKFIFLVAETDEEKEAFCELLGVTPTNSMMVPMVDVLNLIQ